MVTVNKQQSSIRHPFIELLKVTVHIIDTVGKILEFIFGLWKILLLTFRQIFPGRMVGQSNYKNQVFAGPSRAAKSAA